MLPERYQTWKNYEKLAFHIWLWALLSGLVVIILSVVLVVVSSDLAAYLIGGVILYGLLGISALIFVLGFMSWVALALLNRRRQPIEVPTSPSLAVTLGTAPQSTENRMARTELPLALYAAAVILLVVQIIFLAVDPVAGEHGISSFLLIDPLSTIMAFGGGIVPIGVGVAGVLVEKGKYQLFGGSLFLIAAVALLISS